MCTNVKLNLQEKFLKKNKGNKTVTVYKYLKKEDGAIVSPFYTKTWKPGVAKSNSCAKLQTQNGREISRGIYTYLNVRDAKSNVVEPYECVVKLTANISDLICVGGWDDEPIAVFSKVTLSQSEYDKVMKNTKNYVSQIW